MGKKFLEQITYGFMNSSVNFAAVPHHKNEALGELKIFDSAWLRHTLVVIRSH